MGCRVPAPASLRRAQEAVSASSLRLRPTIGLLNPRGEERQRQRQPQRWRQKQKQKQRQSDRATERQRQRQRGCGGIDAQRTIRDARALQVRPSARALRSTSVDLRLCRSHTFLCFVLTDARGSNRTESLAATTSLLSDSKAGPSLALSPPSLSLDQDQASAICRDAGKEGVTRRGRAWTAPDQCEPG
eukprot:594739-Rhodomonas_salina.3